MKKIGILTSGDYLFAGTICLGMLQNNTNYRLIDVRKSQKNIEVKQLKIFFLFGLLGTIRSLYKYFKVRFLLRDRNAIDEVSKSRLYQFLKDSDFDQIVMINYPWKFDVTKYDRVINFHPGELPSYRGLMPICHTLKEAISGCKDDVDYCLTAHYIDDDFDRGVVISESYIHLEKQTPIYDVYCKVYSLINDFLLAKNFEKYGNFNPAGRIDKYHYQMSWREVLSLKLNLLRHYKYGKFLINGGMVGVASWFLQVVFYESINFLFPGYHYSMITSVYMAFFFAMFLSFFSLRKYVFKKDGIFLGFALTSFSMITIVGAVSQFIEKVILITNVDFLVFISYPVSALIISPLSYCVKSKVIFNRTGNKLN